MSARSACLLLVFFVWGFLPLFFWCFFLYFSLLFWFLPLFCFFFLVPPLIFGVSKDRRKGSESESEEKGGPPILVGWSFLWSKQHQKQSEALLWGSDSYALF